jgi:hypothetical protein
MFARGVIATLLACSLMLSTGETHTMAHAKATPKTLESPQKAAPLVEQYLLAGRLSEGEQSLKTHLATHARDDQARFGLGLLQFLLAIEGASQQINYFGIRNWEGQLPAHLAMFKLPINQLPHQISYEQLRKIFLDFHDKVAEAESTLSGITTSDVTLPIHFGLIELDFTGRGEAANKENRRLWELYSEVSRNQQISATEAESFFIKFDRGDVHWLRGYCHVFLALSNIILAYNSQASFDSSAHLFFARVDSPYKFLAERRFSDKSAGLKSNLNEIFDVIAGLHHLQCEVVEPERMNAALKDLEEVVSQSRESWRWIMAETDDDHEWLPNPKQTGVIPNMQVTDEMVSSWMEIMDENEKILQGKLLIPFWRGNDTEVGINLRKVFLEPRNFDLVDWIQGVAAQPYLEKGALSKGDNWTRMRSGFPTNFPGFVLYFN